MGTYLQRLANAFSGLGERGERIRPRSIRAGRLIYAFAYMFELLFYAFRGHFFAMQTSLAGIPGNTVVMAAHGLASLAVMLLWGKRFKPLIRVSVALAFAGFVPFLFLPLGYPRLICAAIGYIGLGGAVTAARCGFAFALNNAERLLGMFLMFFGAATIRCADTDKFTSKPLLIGTAILLLAGMSVCLLCFREDALELKETSDRADAKGLYWALAYFIAYFTIDGYVWSLLEATRRVEDGFLFIGYLIAGVLLFAMLLFSGVNVWHTWNLFFVAAVAAAVLALFSPALGTYKPLYLVSGVSMIGWPLSIYMLACAQRRFADLRLLKRCTVIFVIAAPICNFSSDLLDRYATAAVPAVSLIVILCTVLLFLTLSPFGYKYLFQKEWIPELHQTDMTRACPPGLAGSADAAETPEPADPFAPYGLTPRQREVAALLLEAKTRRQIAGELKLSESTVKTHVADLYKKLDINSRAELFRLFGSTAPKE